MIFIIKLIVFIIYSIHNETANITDIVTLVGVEVDKDQKLDTLIVGIWKQMDIYQKKVYLESPRY